MSCCGQGRRRLRIDPLRTGAEPPPLPPRTPPEKTVRVAYLGRNALTVRGTYSGRAYAFSPRHRLRHVDVDDSRVLLRTRYFRLA